MTRGNIIELDFLSYLIAEALALVSDPNDIDVKQLSETLGDMKATLESINMDIKNKVTHV